MKFYDHPSTHGHDVNMDLCGVSLHRICDGFSGGHDTYLCGCCCHDPDDQLTDDERRQVARVRSLEWFLQSAPPDLIKFTRGHVNEAQRVPGYPSESMPSPATRRVVAGSDSH